MMRNLVFGIFAIVTAAVYVCPAAPQPAVVPGPGNWTLDVIFEPPQEILVQLGGDSRPTRFWYTLLTLTNKTNTEVDFYPRCELMTDTFQIIPAGKDTPAVVFEQIKRRHQGKYPFLEYVEAADNKILQGQDNARDIAIIWRDFDAKAKNIKLFVAGLSNETVAVEHPTAKDETGKPVKVFLRKTLELSYGVSGDAALRSDANLSYESRRWVMR